MTRTYCNRCDDRVDNPSLTLNFPASVTVHLCAKCTRDLGKWLGIRL